MPTAFDLGLIHGLTVFDVYLTFRVLGTTDLIVDSFFATGAAVATVMITTGQNPWLATLGGPLAGCMAGTVIGLFHVNAGVHPLLAGILTQISLYSINLHILDEASVPLLHGVETLLAPSRDKGLLGSWISTPIFATLIAIITTLFNWLFSTQIGLGMRSAGGNEGMARTQGVSIGTMKVTGLALSNGLATSSGVIIAQYQGYTDISIGIGLIVASLTSVIIGTALIGSQRAWVTSFFVAIGSIVYRVIIQLTLGIEFLEANGMRLVSAIIVFTVLTIPRIGTLSKIHERRCSRNFVPEPDITYTSEERDNGKVMFRYWASRP